MGEGEWRVLNERNGGGKELQRERGLMVVMYVWVKELRVMRGMEEGEE